MRDKDILYRLRTQEGKDERFNPLKVDADAIYLMTKYSIQVAPKGTHWGKEYVARRGKVEKRAATFNRAICLASL